MSTEPLLIEIGCEEIPARMIRRAGEDLAQRLCGIFERSGLAHGPATAWGGSRRLAVRVDDVQPHQEDRDELVLGPPATIAFTPEGQPTRAAAGFASKQGIDPADLAVHETQKGPYAGFRRTVAGKTVGDLLAEALPAEVASMSFPKTMRWAEGRWRWVRPVHWVLALHGHRVLPLELFGVEAAGASLGHRFLSDGPVRVGHPDRYDSALLEAHVVADPAERRRRLEAALHEAAERSGGRLLEDATLLDEVADLVEWPGVVEGRFDETYLELPRELLVTTLRHHQKCFSVQDAEGRLLPAFVAVANTDRDPSTHIRRGNEWVIGGRLEDARFFWQEDRRTALADRSAALDKVVFHAAVGSYADKARRMADVAGAIAERLGFSAEQGEHCRQAALLAKNDLVTGTVGEFPELQGRVGGLLVTAEGGADSVARAIYEHYQPVGPDDHVPHSVEGGVVSVADKLDGIGGLVAAGENPTGSRDPFALRRAGSGVFRTVIAHGWALSLTDLAELSGGSEGLMAFLLERFRNFLREAGFGPNEIQAVLRPKIDPEAARGWTLPDVMARLEAIRAVRRRSDFAHLADLTKRVDNILAKGAEQFEAAVRDADAARSFVESSEPALRLAELVARRAEEVFRLEREGRYADVVDVLAGFVDPVERFFEAVLVLDPERPAATLHRREVLARLGDVLTRCFDIRELAGQAERRVP